MASPIRFMITSNLLTGSVVPFRPVVPIAVSAYHSLSINNMIRHHNDHPTNVSKVSLLQTVSNRILAASSQSRVNLRSCERFGIISHRNYTTGSYGFLQSTFTKGKYFIFNAPGLKTTQSDESLCVFVDMPRVKKEDVKVHIEHKHGTALVIEGKTDEVNYLGSMRLPEIVDKTSSDIKGEMMQDGMLKLTLPKLKDKQVNKTSIIIARYRSKFILRVLSSLFFVFRPLARLYLLKDVCPEPFNSASMYKEETGGSLKLRLMPGLEKMEFTKEGVCVSLSMPELEIEDVKSYFKHDGFFVEGKTKLKTKKVHYITGIRLPKNVVQKRKMIKTEMKDGIYKAILPYETIDIDIN